MTDFILAEKDFTRYLNPSILLSFFFFLLLLLISASEIMLIGTKRDYVWKGFGGPDELQFLQKFIKELPGYATAGWPFFP